MIEKLNNVSGDAVKKATGRDWDQWIAFLNDHGGAHSDHKGLVALLAGPGGVGKAWWQQMVAVGYEQATGKRVTGETADAGFQLGVQKTIAMDQTALWELLVGPHGSRLWADSAEAIPLEPGTTFTTRNGARCEMRTVKPRERLRLAWYDPAGERHTILQLTLACPRNTPDRTSLRFHHEKLADTKERDRMRSHWKNILEQIVSLVSTAR